MQRRYLAGLLSWNDQMDVKIICDICKHKVAERSCRLCGKRVCRDDYNSDMDMCRSCAAGRSAHRDRER